MSSPTYDAVRIRLLGPVELAGDDHALGGPKQRMLLAVLAIRAGEVVPTDALIDVLWPSDLPDDPGRSLQVQVSKLRRVLEAVGVPATIEHGAGGYVLRTERGAVDTARFTELVEEGAGLVDRDPERATELLDEALALRRGRPLTGIPERTALVGEVARLEDLGLRAVEARLDADLALGRDERATAELTRLTRQHPLRERFWQQLMLALYRRGQRAAALDAYDRCRRVLREELGLDPSRLAQELHARILREDEMLDRAAIPRDDPVVGGRHPRPGSVAILPFEVIGGADDAALLAVGLHNDLLTELSKVPTLTVISRSSVIAYRGTDRPSRTIARELDVAAVVEGTVQSAGQRFRVTVQLIDGARDVQRWAESYDADLTAENLFAIQSALAGDIAASLSSELTDTPTAVRPEGTQTHSLEAYRLTAAGRQHFDLKTEGGFVTAIDCFEEAVRLDPDYADGWTALADALVSMDAYGYGDRHDLLPRAEQALHRALALAPDSAGARTSLGVLHIGHQDGPSAVREFRAAMAVGPSYADASNWHSWVSLLVGDAGAGLEASLRAVELDPRSAEAYGHVALAYTATGAPEAGLAAARQAHRLSPYETGRFYVGLCLAELGRDEEARRVLEPLAVADRDGGRAVPWAGGGAHAVLALSLARGGERDRARAIAEALDEDGLPFAAGLVQLGLGRVEAAATAFARVERMDAWPCLAVHHFHRDLWADLAPTGQHRELLRTARRSWRMPASDA